MEMTKKNEQIENKINEIYKEMQQNANHPCHKLLQFYNTPQRNRMQTTKPNRVHNSCFQQQFCIIKQGMSAVSEL